VLCKSPDDAEGVKRELSSATDTLRNAIAPERAAPGQPDWAGLLRNGTFARSGSEVTAIWPLERSFLEALTAPTAP
jgi:hypothetical protein